MLTLAGLCRLSRGALSAPARPRRCMWRVRVLRQSKAAFTGLHWRPGSTDVSFPSAHDEGGRHRPRGAGTPPKMATTTTVRGGSATPSSRGPASTRVSASETPRTADARRRFTKETADRRPRPQRRRTSRGRPSFTTPSQPGNPLRSRIRAD